MTPKYSVAILGGSRFIGHAIAEGLLGRGHRLITVNRGMSRAAYSGEVERVFADRRDPVSYHETLKRVEADWVVDVTGYCAEDTKVAAEAFGGRVEGFIHISSMSVYRLPFPCPIPEKSPLETDSANEYGFHKAECERVLDAVSNAGFPCTILRLPAVFGPGDPFSRERYLLGNLLQGRPVMVPEKPFLVQNIFSMDVAEAVCRLIERGSNHAKCVYNLGGPAFALEEYLALLGRLAGAKPFMIRSPDKALRSAEVDMSRLPYFFDGHLVMDTTRITNDIGFEARSSLEALSLTVRWIFEHQRPTVYWGLPWEHPADPAAFQR